MLPLEPKKLKDGVSRARMYIKRDLDLFIGYPDPERVWVSFPEKKEPETILITGKYIHNATFTINKLVRDFQKALPAIVGDVSKWSNRYKNLLEILKLPIHSGIPLPESLVYINSEFGEAERKLYKKLILNNPSITHVINSLSWITCLKPESFLDALVWLENNITYVSGICRNLGTSDGLIVIVRLWRLSTDIGEKRISTISSRVADNRIYTVPMEQGVSYSCQIDTALGRKRSDSMPPIPKAKFGKYLIQWIGWLSKQDNKAAKRAIDLFDLISDIRIDSWEKWWKSLNFCIKDAEKIPRPLMRSDPLISQLNHIRDKIKSIGENSPSIVNSKLLFQLVKKWSDGNRTNDFEEIYKALLVLPATFDNVPVRLAFLHYWDILIDENGISRHPYMGRGRCGKNCRRRKSIFEAKPQETGSGFILTLFTEGCGKRY